MNDQGSLALNEDHLPSGLTPGSAVNAAGLDLGSNIKLDVQSRDRMFALTLSLFNSGKTSPKFPSLDVLNHIIQVFFVREKYRVDNWTHAATFNPSDASPYLLNALVSTGSTAISVPAIWKMGLALQDVIRLSLGKLVRT